MAASAAAPQRVEKEAEALEQKYQSDALSYAQARSEDSQIRGDKESKEHWEDVAAILGDDADDDDG